MWLDLRSLWERTELAGNAGSISVAGQSATLSINLPGSNGSISIDGQTATLQLGTVITPTAGSISIDGQSASFLLGVAPSAGSITIAGQTGTFSINLPAGAGAIGIAGASGTFAIGVQPANGSISINGQTGTLQLSGSLNLDGDAGSITVQGQSAVFNLTGQGAYPPPAGTSKRKRRYEVEIDGQIFPVESIEQAQALFDRAREIAQKRAPIIAESIVRQKLNDKTREGKPIRVPAPQVSTANDELQEIVIRARHSLAKIYYQAAIDAEIRLRLLKQQDDDDDEDLMLLL